MKVLLIEDEYAIAEFVSAGLAAHGMTVTHLDDGQRGLEEALRARHDAILLDLMLPGRDGLDVLRELRGAGVTTPVILLTARNELGDRVKGLELGADDYLAKPFYVEELAARLHAVLRRLSGERRQTVQAAGLELDRLARTARWHGQTVELTGREFALLEYLVRSPGHVFTRAQILEHVWGYDFDPSTNIVDQCVRRIRSHLGDVDASGDAAAVIESVRGVGYRCRPDTP